MTGAGEVSDRAMQQAITMAADAGSGEDAVTARRRRSALILTAAFWIFAFGVLSLRSELTDDLPFTILGPRRLLIAAFGVMLCLAMVRLLDALRRRSFVQWIIWGTAGAFGMATALTTFSMMLNRVIAPLPGAAPINFVESAQWVMIWLGYCLAWTGTYLALSYHWDVEEQRMRMARMTALAKDAQIAALRYQINPHFLFNTLNSISSLVLERRYADAETMLLNLAAFVRTTIEGDPHRLIALREEIRLQRLYIDIERVRFSERLVVVIDVPDDVAETLVPALILQPLVENALRHGVAQAETLTTLAIRAVRAADAVHLSIEDDSAARGAPAAGGGLGLRNVRDRLHAHFGDGARLTVGRGAGGGYRSAIELPAGAPA